MPGKSWNGIADFETKMPRSSRSRFALNSANQTGFAFHAVTPSKPKDETRERQFVLAKLEWHSRFRDEDAALKSFTIRAELGQPNRFRFSRCDSVEAQGRDTGTTVCVSEIRRESQLLERESVLEKLALEFAPYLKSYPTIRISYDDKEVNPAALQTASYSYPLEDIALSQGMTSAELEIVEWARSVDRAIYFCDEAGVTRGHVPARIRAPGFDFTAYLRCKAVQGLADTGAILLDDLSPDVSALAEAARAAMRDHFKARREEEAARRVAHWKQSGLYPYDGEPSTLVERAERKVFDVIALEVSSDIPDFDMSSAKSQRLSFRLLREALATDPGALHEILAEVLDLPIQKRNELAQLLSHTTLEAIIEASRTIANRLDFLQGLEILLFEPGVKEKTLERKHLHQILASNTWLFGEEFALTVSDQTLNTVLRRHLSMTNADLLSQEASHTIRTREGKEGRVDLMLARSIPQPNQLMREYLVVELKRPSKVFDRNALQQLKNYLYAVESDDAFKDTNTRWMWWGIANDLGASVRREANQRDRPEGVAYQSDNATLTVRTWGQVIRDARARLNFFKDKLEYEANRSSAVKHLQDVYDRYLPDVLRKETDS